MSFLGPFVILLTFMPGATTGTWTGKVVCQNPLCVADVMDQAHESRLLSRLRVFAEDPSILPAGNTRFPPIVDQWYQ